MFNTTSRRFLRQLEESVRAGSLHRWLVVPAVLAILIAVMRASTPLVAVALVPPLAVLPWIALASLTPTSSLRTPVGTAAIPLVGAAAFAWSCLLALVTGPYGAIAASASVPLLFSVGGLRREKRLAFVAMWLGGVSIIAAIPLAWIGVQPVALATGGAVLIAGGATWRISAACAAPEPVVALPRAIIA